MNLHIMRTVGLNETAYGTKNCIECLYAPTKNCHPASNGTLFCCLSTAVCPLANTTNPSDVKNYFFRWNVTWKLYESTDQPLSIFVLDASNCQIEYNIYGSNSSNMSITTLTWPTPPQAFQYVKAIGHQHQGGYNISLYHQTANSTDWTLICNSYPTYGTQVGVAGNEYGYIISMSACPLSLLTQKGDFFKVISYYDVAPTDPRTWNAQGMHGGVMSYYYLAGFPMH